MAKTSAIGVDPGDVEPLDRLRQGLGWMRTLLRGGHCRTVPGDSEFPQRLRPDHAPGADQAAPYVEGTKGGLRQLDVRPLPGVSRGNGHRRRLGDHAGGRLARIPGPDQTPREGQVGHRPPQPSAARAHLAGVSAEDQATADHRIPVLLDIPAPVRFLSCEPLLGPIDLGAYLQAGGIHWVIDGGESGPGRRPADYGWFRSIRDQCLEFSVPYFHKQGNAPHPGKDRMLDGRAWDGHPNRTALQGSTGNS